MKVKKIYFNRKHDQWVGDTVYIEDELDAQGLHVKIMDVEFNSSLVSTIMADFRDSNGGVYSVKGTPDYDKRIVVFKIPLQILSNDGLYEVVFSISYYSQNGNDKLIKTAIQTFTIRDTIESDDEAIQQETHYPILVDLVNEISKYKVDVTEFIKEEDAERIIKEKIDAVVSGMNGVNKDELKEILLNYVLKEEGKGLSTHDLTDELYEKLVNLEGVIDLSIYQTKTDSNLITTSKEIVGSINEVKTDVTSMSDNLSNINEKIVGLENISAKNKIDIEKILNAVDTPPTFTKPTLSISLNKSTINHNVSTDIIITPRFNKNDGGDITGYTLKKGSETLLNLPTIQAYTDSINISHGNSITYTATISYASGESKFSTFEVEYSGLPAGDISTNATVRAYANSYYGVINNNTITDPTNLISRLGTSKGFTMTYNMTNQRSVYMYPKSFGALTSIKDANNFEYINSYTRSEITWDEVVYYVYILTDPVSITGFKQIFN